MKTALVISGTALALGAGYYFLVYRPEHQLYPIPPVVPGVAPSGTNQFNKAATTVCQKTAGSYAGLCSSAAKIGSASDAITNRVVGAIPVVGKPIANAATAAKSTVKNLAGKVFGGLF